MAVEDATPAVTQVVKEDIVVCLDGEALAFIDMLIKVVGCKTRSRAVALLVRIQAQQQVLQQISSEMAAEIQRLREEDRRLADR